MTERPLSGYRVVDFTHAAAGPYATMWLADLGAEVIKIEKPGRGDGARYMGEPLLGKKDSDYYVALNAGKKSLLLDLGKEEGVEIARRLIATADLVVSNFRPGVMERLGLGFDDIKGLREGLIVCTLSAFGADGPWAGRPANDIIVQGVTGLMDITGEPEGDPVRVGSPVCDFSTGLFAFAGVLAAVLNRDRHPEGQHVEVTMFDSTMALMANYVPSVLDMGKEVPRLGRGHPQIVPYQAFRCAGDGYMMVGAFTSAFWRRLAAAVGHEEWIADPRFESNAARVQNRAVLVPLFEEIFAGHDRDHWVKLLGEHDVPCTPINSAREALESDLARHTVHHLTAADGRSAHVIASPIRVPGWDPSMITLPPPMGQDTDAVLGGILGLSDDDIDDLCTRGVTSRKEQQND